MKRLRTLQRLITASTLSNVTEAHSLKLGPALLTECLQLEKSSSQQPTRQAQQRCTQQLHSLSLEQHFPGVTQLVNLSGFHRPLYAGEYYEGGECCQAIKCFYLRLNVVADVDHNNCVVLACSYSTCWSLPVKASHSLQRSRAFLHVTIWKLPSLRYYNGIAKPTKWKSGEGNSKRCCRKGVKLN